MYDVNRVRVGPRKPGKSWNLIIAFFRTGKSWEKASGNQLNSTTKYEMYGKQ